MYDLQDDISTPINAQIFELYNSDLFPETLQNSEGGASCSNYCYEDNSSYSTTLALPSDINKFTSTHENNGSTATTTTAAGGGPPATSTTATTTANANNSSNLSIIFDSQEEIENEITASLGFSASPPFSVPQFFNPQTEQFDIATIQTQIQISDVPVDGLSQFPPEAAPPLIGGPPLSSMCEDECLSSLPSYMRLNPSSPPPCSFVDPAAMGSYLLGNFTATLSGDSSGIFSGGVLMGPELQPQELDQYQGDNGGIYCQDSMQRVFNSAELQVVFTNHKHFTIIFSLSLGFNFFFSVSLSFIILSLCIWLETHNHLSQCIRLNSTCTGAIAWSLLAPQIKYIYIWQWIIPGKPFQKSDWTKYKRKTIEISCERKGKKRGKFGWLLED